MYHTNYWSTHGKDTFLSWTVSQVHQKHHHHHQHHHHHHPHHHHHHHHHHDFLFLSIIILNHFHHHHYHHHHHQNYHHGSLSLYITQSCRWSWPCPTTPSPRWTKWQARSHWSSWWILRSSMKGRMVSRPRKEQGNQVLAPLWPLKALGRLSTSASSRNARDWSLDGGWGAPCNMSVLGFIITVHHIMLGEWTTVSFGSELLWAGWIAATPQGSKLWSQSDPWRAWLECSILTKKSSSLCEAFRFLSWSVKKSIKI